MGKAADPLSFITFQAQSPKESEPGENESIRDDVIIT